MCLLYQPYWLYPPSALTEATEPAVSTNKAFWAHSLLCPSLKLEKSRNADCLSEAWDLWGSGPAPFFPALIPPPFIFFTLSFCFSPTPPSPASCSSKCLLNSHLGARWLWGFCSQRFKFRRTRVWEEHEEHCSQVQPRRNESQFPTRLLEEGSIFES